MGTVKNPGKQSPTPVKEMPDCWQDDSRMNSLFAPFRDRTLNPHDWDSKLTFWSSMIDKWCKENDACSFTLEDLNKAFLRNGRIPACLPTVIQELNRSGHTSLMSDFLKTSPLTNSWSGWVVDMTVKKPMSWAWQKVKGMVFSPPNTPQTRYVHHAATKFKGEAVLSCIGTDSRGELMEVQTFLSKCKLSHMSAVDATALVHWLHCQGHAAVISQRGSESEEHTLIKLKLEGATQRPAITDVDHGIYALSCNERTLTHNIEKLEKERQEALSEAKSYLAKGMRTTAKSCLRKKKELEKCIEKRASALENVQLLLARIREATSDSQVLDAYKVGVAALKQTFKETGLTEDDVSDTMDEVKEILDIHNDIQAVLSEPIDTTVDGDLEGELELLLADTSPSAPGNGGNCDDSIHSLEKRLQELAMRGSPSPPSPSATQIYRSPKPIPLDDLPETPKCMPSPPGANMTPI